MKIYIHIIFFTFLVFNLFNLQAQQKKQPIKISKYQFKIKTTNQNLSQENFLLTIFTDEKILLESKSDGFFYEIEADKKKIQIAKGSYFFQISSGSKSSLKQKIVIENQKIIFVNVDNIFSSNNLKTFTTIKVDKFFKKDADKVSLIAKEVKLIPGSGNDIFSSAVSIPGITGSSQNGEIFIRGSDRNDIYYAINNIRISNPFHSVFYSAIPNAVINSLNIYLGGFKNNFANVQGGIIQAKTKKIKNYIPKKTEIEIDFNFVYTGINFNIPITADMRLNLGGKRSYYSIWLDFLDAINFYKSLGFHDVKLKPFFQDYNIFFDWKISKDLYLRFFTILSEDDNDVAFEALITNRSGQQLTNTIQYRNIEHWNTEALEIIYKKEKLKNNFSLYHYGNTNFYSYNQDVFDLYQRDFFVLKNDFSYTFFKNEDSRLIYNLGTGITYELATFISKQHPDGKKIPIASEYGVFFDGNGRPKEDNDRFQQYTNDYLKYQNELVSRVTKPYRLVSESYSSLEITFLINFDFSIGGNLNYNSYSEQIDIDWRSQIVYRNSSTLFFFLKGGKYSQFPELFININQTVEPQAKYLKTPFAYHLNFGFDLSFAIFTLNAEGYYKYLSRQEINNPTYDTAFPENENENPKTLNIKEGWSYGLDIFLKQSFTKSSFGWVSYSWNISERTIFIDSFRESLTTFGINNGKTYQDLKTKILPFYENIEHVFKILYSFEIIKNWQFGLNGSILSGKRFHKYLLDELTLNDGSTVFILKRSGDYGRFPWRFTLHSRIDWTFFKNEEMTLSAYLDFQHIHTLFIKNVNSYNYDLATFNKEKNTTYKDLKKGDPFPEDAIFPVNSIERILGILGVILKF